MDENETIKLAIKSLLEVVQTGAKNIEIAVMLSDNTVKVNFKRFREKESFAYLSKIFILYSA